jgi:hypothetical protein
VIRNTASPANDTKLELWRPLYKPGLWLIFGSFVFLYLHLFRLPLTPIWTGGDATIFLHDARRMLDGEVLYRDFVQITLPGTDFLYFAAFKIFGARMWVANAMLVLLGLALVWLSYFISKAIDLGKAALLPPLLFLTLVYRDRLDATHHWYSSLAVLAALALAIDLRSPLRVAISGTLCGLAACFTQSLGLMTLLAFAVFLSWEHGKTSTRRRSLILREAVLFGSFAGTVLIVTSYFAWKAGLAKFVYSTFLFNLRYYPSLGANAGQGYMIGLPGFLHWRQIPSLLGFLLLHALLPFVYLLFLVRYRRQSRRAPEERWDRLMLVNLVGLFSLLSVAAAPTWARLYYVSLPALILFTWMLKFEGRAGRFLSNSLYVLTVILAVASPIAKQLHWHAYLDLPTGRTAFLTRATYERYRWAASQTQASEFFFGGAFPDFYFLLNLRNPGPVPFITPYEYTRPDEVQRVMRGLEMHRVRIVLWTPILDLPDDPQGDHLGPLRAYVRNHYHVAKDFPDYEVWVRDP